MRWSLLVLLIGCAETEPPDIVVDRMVMLDVVLAPGGLTLFADSTTPFVGSLSTRVQSLRPGREHLTSLGLVRVWPASEPTTHQLAAATKL